MEQPVRKAKIGMFISKAQNKDVKEPVNRFGWVIALWNRHIS